MNTSHSGSGIRILGLWCAIVAHGGTKSSHLPVRACESISPGKAKSPACMQWRLATIILRVNESRKEDYSFSNGA